MHDMRLIAPDATTLNFRVKDGRIVMGNRAAQFLIGRSVADTLAWAEKSHWRVQMPPLRLTQLSLRIVRGLAASARCASASERGRCDERLDHFSSPYYGDCYSTVA
jgi:hypothetical protein